MNGNRLLPGSICAFFFLLFAFSVSGQHFHPFVISVHDFSLENSFEHFESFDIETDSNEYCYLAGPKGLFRFNGHQAFRLLERKGLENISYIDLRKDPNGQLWVYSYSRGLMRIVADSVLPYPYNDTIHRYWIKRPLAYHMDNDGTLHLGLHSGGHRTVSPRGGFRSVFDRRPDVHGIILTRLPDGTLFPFTSYLTDSLRPNMTIYYQHADGRLDSIGRADSKQVLYEVSLLEHDSERWTLSLGSNTIFYGRADSLEKTVTFPFKIIKLFSDSRANLWIGTIDHGIHRIPANPAEDTLHLLPGQTAAVTAESADGMLWIKSDKTFFYCLPDQDLLVHSFESSLGEPRKVLELAVGDSALYCLIESGNIAIIKQDSIRQITPPKTPPIKGMRADDRLPVALHFQEQNHLLYAGYWNMVAQWDGHEWESVFFHPLRRHFIDRANLFISNDTSVVFACPKSGVYAIDSSGITKLTTSDTHVVRIIHDLAYDEQRNVILGTATGMWLLENGMLKRPTVQPEAQYLIASTIDAVASIGADIYAHSREHGMFLIHEDRLKAITDSAGNAIHAYAYFSPNQHELWMQVEDKGEGIIQVLAKDSTPVFINFYLHDFVSRYGSLNQAIAILNDELFLGTMGGVFKKKLKRLKRHGFAPNVLIRQAFANQEELQVSEHSLLAHDQNNLHMLLDAVSFRRHKPQIQCRLVGLDSHWNTLQYHAIQYTNLAPGNYTFQVRGRINNEPWSNVRAMSFLIQTPFWQTWWFITLEVALVLLLSTLVSFTWFRIRHKRAVLELDKSSAEQRALRAQMNPHFVFNVLSSIQDMVFHEDRVHAVKYIARFAHLMRKILSHSGKEAISLAEEVETLTNYLQLEALRFDHKFAFYVTTAKDMDMNKYHLPPLLLQPLVENAIKHGIMNKKPPVGRVDLSFEQGANGVLLCSVTDDGIGRQQAEALQKERKIGAQSFGLISIRERIALLNARRKHKITFKIMDLTHETGEPRGTHIELSIPQKSYRT